MSDNLTGTVIACVIALVIGVCISLAVATSGHSHSPGVTHITTNITNR